MNDELSIGDYLAIIRRRALAVGACFAAALIVGVVWSLLQTPRYQATATVLIDSGSAADIFDPVTGEARGARAVTNEARFALSDQVRESTEGILAASGLDVAAEAYTLSVTESSTADELRLRASSRSAAGAALVAQTFADQYITLSRERAVADYLATADVIQSRVEAVEQELAQLDPAESARRAILEAQLSSFSSALSSLDVTAELGGAGSRQIISRARVPSAPFSPQTSRNVLIAAVLGLLAGVGLALLLESLDRSIQSKDDIEEATSGIANLAVVPTVRDWRERSATRIETVQSPQSPTSEAYRTLRTSLEFASIDRDVRTLQVTSANPGEGKTTTAVNLAVSIARAGSRVIVIDADLRKPRMHAFFDVPVEPGLTNAILGQVPSAEVGHVVERDAGSLTVLTSGPLPPGPSELLGSSRTRAILDELKELADLVIVDSAPVLPVADALVLAKQVDATLLVANASRTAVPEVQDAVERLTQVDAHIVGTVLNQVRRRGGNGYGYGYSYEQDASGSGSTSASRRRSFASNA